MCDFFFFGGDFLFSFGEINNMTSYFFDKLCFFKIFNLHTDRKKKQLFSTGVDDLFAEADRVTACDAQTQVLCLLTARPSSVPRRAARSSGSNRTLVSSVKYLTDVSWLFAAIKRPFSTLVSVASVECLLLNSGWKSWKIKGQMVCDVANNQFSNRFEMKGQLEKCSEITRTQLQLCLRCQIWEHQQGLV